MEAEFADHMLSDIRERQKTRRKIITFRKITKQLEQLLIWKSPRLSFILQQ